MAAGCLLPLHQRLCQTLLIEMTYHLDAALMLVLHVQQHVPASLDCLMLCELAAELKCLQHAHELSKPHQKHWHGIAAW